MKESMSMINTIYKSEFIIEREFIEISENYFLTLYTSLLIEMNATCLLYMNLHFALVHYLFSCLCCHTLHSLRVGIMASGDFCLLLPFLVVFVPRPLFWMQFWLMWNQFLRNIKMDRCFGPLICIWGFLCIYMQMSVFMCICLVVWLYYEVLSLTGFAF